MREVASQSHHDERFPYVADNISEALTRESSLDVNEFLDEYNKKGDCQDSSQKGSKSSLFIEDSTLTLKWDFLEEYVCWYFHREQKNNEDDELLVSSDIFLPLDILILIACQSESLLLSSSNNNNNLPAYVKGLVNLSNFSSDSDSEAEIVIALTFSLYLIESKIRTLSGHEHNKAPLLKNMIENFTGKEKMLSPLLRTLLLPKENGINLRNLLWHGFINYIPKRWFSLCVVLLLSLEAIAEKEKDSEKARLQMDFFTSKNAGKIDILLKHDSLLKLTEHGKHIVSSSDDLKKFTKDVMNSDLLPKSYHKLFCSSMNLLQYENKVLPICFTSIISIMIEHSLRLRWCDLNYPPLYNGRNKRIATSEEYYVTLDGHGQRDLHDIILMPYIRNSEQKNLLIENIGGPTIALLTDLYASPASLGGPNVRASIAHGAYYYEMMYEIETLSSSTSTTGTSTIKNDQFRYINATSNLAYLTISLIQILISNTKSNAAIPQQHLLKSYVPLFSFTSCTFSSIENTIKNLSRLDSFIRKQEESSVIATTTSSKLQQEIATTLATHRKNIDALRSMKYDIYDSIGSSRKDDSKELWTHHDVFHEYKSNLIFVDCGACRTLLVEINTALLSYLETIENMVQEQNQSKEKTMSSRRIKQIQRTLSMVKLSYDFYSFVSFVGLLYLSRAISERKKEGELQDKYGKENVMMNELLHAVKRSRMCVSTFSTADNTDRALKSLSQYYIGKHMKAIIKYST